MCGLVVDVVCGVALWCELFVCMFEEVVGYVIVSVCAVQYISQLV